ncbi:P22_AR N-terminal domain [Serratia proteamaculans]|uniref:phage antirepressor N-terminal domain-containing protein n=1 Tax=Serratia proteamaculans TaxID=28151 RepID=UPI002183574E|nr:phage antirepressor N-terminal domain-containing protein [Serratia proteamaculans]CAI2429640.1 P22_AR N-terminal domain [Serratia proteamaculans]
MNNQLVVVSFRNQPMQAIQRDGSVFVVMRPVCEGIGLDWAAQTVKLKRMRDKFSCCDIATTGSDGKRYKMLCIPLRKLNGWLFSVNPEKVHPEIKDNLIAYQEECFEVLHDHFTKGEAAHPRRQSTMQQYKIHTSCRVLHTYNELGVIVHSHVARDDEMLTSPKGFIELMMRRQGL